MPQTPHQHRTVRPGRGLPAAVRHSRQKADRQRGSAAARGYGARWRKLRKMFLRANPICNHAGCEAPAAEVDHKIPIAAGGARFDWDNLQALCKSHHSQKTATTDGGFGRRS